ncbi:Histidine--tRNA ligase [Melia azedarach]|uniref:Histidine--tRNA ligase n=1 Tax=Melia azedarach TaxID=155640 RepID=A0ACC1YVX7_MELAZ|nr:Histidine--tRNA ligase [Melia azedarach]
MKHQHISGESSLGHDSKRTIGEKIRQAYEAAMVAVGGDHGVQRGRSGRSINRGTERRKSSYRAEDPIRTMMFLGSWSHT